MTEHTVPLHTLPRRYPCVPGIEPGMIATGTPHGRRFLVLQANEWIITCADGADFDAQTANATGPYAVLQALDDPSCTVAWPRDWYTVAGQQMELLEA